MRQAAETAQPRPISESAPASQPFAAVLAFALLSGIFLLPLLCWPDLDAPFSIPKLWLLGYLAIVAGLSSKMLGRAAWQWLAWPAAAAISALAASTASVEALLLAALPLPLAFAISRGRVPAERVISVLLCASAVESAVAILQYCGVDPFRLLGWAPEQFANSRMRVYGTLGNPNFVAAWLCGTLPLYAGVLSGKSAQRADSSGRTFQRAVPALVPAPGRRASAGVPMRHARVRAPHLHTTNAFGCGSTALWSTLLALQAAAIAATGSRAPLIAVPAALAVLVAGRNRAGKWLLAAAVPVAAALLWFSPARSLGETVEGRLYVAGVATAHLKEVPPWGFGPGGFRLKFAEWQAGWLKQRGRASDNRFTGPLDHAHNDYLEFWVDHGALGLGAFLFVCGWLIWSARRVYCKPRAKVSWRTLQRAVPALVPTPGRRASAGVPVRHARVQGRLRNPETGSAFHDCEAGPRCVVTAWSAAAGVAALLATAMVDFPFHRPAEWSLLWVLAAVPGGLLAGRIEIAHGVTSDQKLKSENTCPVQSEDLRTSQ